MTLWPAAPDPLPPLGDDVHVWAVALNDPGCEIDSCRALLSPDEQAHANRFKFARDRKRYVVAHAALRGILSRYTHAAAAELRFSQGIHGKPQLTAPFSASGIEFNLSHSHEAALVAPNSQHQIGVDLEFAKSDFEIFEVASRFFTEREVAELRALPAALQRQGFYKCWTSKEAFLKAKGTGLSGQLDEMRIALAAEGVRIAAAVTGWALTELALGEGYEAALVTIGKPPQVFCYRWQLGW